MLGREVGGVGEGGVRGVKAEVVGLSRGNVGNCGKEAGEKKK